MEQLSFDLGEPAHNASGARIAEPWAPPNTGLNLYFMVFPGPAAAERIFRCATGLKRRHGLFGRQRPTEILHMTLYPLGWDRECPAEMVEAARNAGSDVTVAPFDLTLDRCLSFNGERPAFVLSCGEAKPLADLQAFIADALRCFMPWVAPWGFRPHMTLLYDRKAVAEEPLDEPITFRVNEFALINSHHGETRYEELGRWPLNGVR